MLRRTYVRWYPKAKHNDPCTICGISVLDEPIYFHGYGWNDPTSGKRGDHGTVSHEGCFWDEMKHGPAPYLTWGQIATLNNAIVGRDRPDTKQAERFLSAVSNALKQRESAMYHADQHVALRLGPALVEGYGMVLARLDSPDHKIWRLKDESGDGDWEEQRKRLEPPPKPAGPTLDYRKQEQSSWLSKARLSLKQARNGSPFAKRQLQWETRQLSILGIEVRFNEETQIPEYRWKGGSWKPIPEDTKTIHGIQPVAKEAQAR